MLGAIAGDIIGSVYEHHNIKIKNFPLFSSKSKFTDDTVMTVAVADSILNNREYIDTVKEYFRRY
ncbi:MAG: ADP-ribosylglycohydrolase family protein, partial [Okeania sp. SIO2D1]|nr:ADP-ribosylglycohydrolase family protein [Okeania sp. SIO2D1]